MFIETVKDLSLTKFQPCPMICFCMWDNMTAYLFLSQDTLLQFTYKEDFV